MARKPGSSHLLPLRWSRRLRRISFVGYLGIFCLVLSVLWLLKLITIKYLIGQDYGNNMKPHEMSSSNSDLIQKTIISVNTGKSDHFLNTLNKILVQRVVGTPRHSQVKEFIKGQLKSLGWHIISDSFSDITPNFGPLNFENIIAKLNPQAEKYIVLACHYDSKYFSDLDFVGATDSAVPCAMLLNLAECLKQELTSLKDANVSLELWFFDGEEAFVNWGPHDSLYGARHLAQKMEDEKSLSQIKCLILLDLLGMSNPVMYNYYKERELFKHLVASEKALRSEGHLIGGNSPSNMFFRNRWKEHYVEDDHTPFLHRNVPIIHLIPEVFPEVWHTEKDNFDAIDFGTVEDMNKILRLFVLRYFNL